MDQQHAAPTQIDDSVDLGFSFAGGGWLMCYLFGVAKSIRRHNLHHTARFTGTSAGALASIGLALDADFDAITRTVTSSYVPQAHGSLSGPFQMRRYLVDALTRHANLDQFETCNADPLKCTVVYTSLSAFEPRRKSTFSSASHLLETLIASCCATPLVGLPFQFEGEWVIDGGLTENQPRFQSYHNVKRVVNVSPNVLDTDADIRPSQYVPPWWSMYPPSSEELEWVFLLGEKDGHDWCVRNGLAQSTETIEAPVRPCVQQTALGQLFGYQWIETLLLTLVSLLSTSWDLTSTLALVQFEIAARKALSVCMTVASGLFMLWTLALASALRIALQNDTGIALCLCGVYAYVILCGFYISKTIQRIHESPEWVEVDRSLELARDLTPEDPASHHSPLQLSKDNRATLASHSFIFRLTSASIKLR